MTTDVCVVSEPERAQVLLHPTRISILENLEEPGSAASLARQLDVPRQRLNYHLRELEGQGLVDLVEERRRGNVSERIYRRTGNTYAISIDALGKLGSSPATVRDRFSSAYQIAVASQAISDLAVLRTSAAAAKKKLPTFSLEVDVRFADAAARNAFTEELASAAAKLASKYHDEGARGGRVFKFYIGAYPKVTARGRASRPQPSEENN